MKTPIVLFLLGTFLVGCAKERSYDEVYKDSTFTKANFAVDEKDPWKDPWVYVPSVENTPMNVTASRPFWLGDQKLVVFKFSQNQLEVLELPTDKKYTENANNFSPVFKLDIEHKDYRCQEDQYGECNNKEEEIDDKPWQSKRFFKADFSKLTVLETNSLPEQLTNLFQSCFSDKGSVVKSLDMDKDSLNIVVERTITAGVECADLASFDDLRNLTFKVNHHYSFVKLSKLAAPDYEPVKYPFTDQNSFGYFTTVTKKLSADNRQTLDSEVTLMNRWNPKQKEITYYLNDSFYQSNMKVIKKSTEKAMDAINTSFVRAGVDMKIILADGRGKHVGDLRNNFLVLVPDPQASGVIGYGPTVANPMTGQIMKGQVVMYYGTVRKFIQETYDELVLEAQAKVTQAQSEAAAAIENTVIKGVIKENHNSDAAIAREAGLELKRDLVNIFKAHGNGSVVVHKPGTDIVAPVLSRSKLNERLKLEKFSHERILKHHAVDDMVEELSRNNMYHESMVNWNEAVGSAIEAGELDLTNAKPWNDLTDEQKEVLIDKLMPYVWIPTLVHEFGHNLGLRHNFSGSEDKDNYYSTEERKALGIDRDVTFASVMDYSYSSLNQLPVMGKYDLAALRYGYNREIELKDGSIIPLPKASLDEMKKDGSISTVKTFEYCTDEHTSVNAGCNRFDEGSNFKEMAQHYVDAYNKNYVKRNKRNNRLNYSSVDDGTYYSSVQQTFEGLRIFFETFDRIKGIYPNLPEDQWESNEFLKDIKDATKIALKFYLDVLKTPSVHCAIAEIETGDLAGILPIESITQDAISCFDSENIQLNPKYTVFAQTGKHFNHARGPGLRGDIKADPSQLEMRGIWIDKILAMNYLMKREMKISSFDDYRTSFIDHPEFKDEIVNLLIDMMSDKLELTADFELADGSKIPQKHLFKIGDTFNIKKSFSGGINKLLGFNRASIDFREFALPLLRRNLQTSDDEATTVALLDSFSVYRVGASVYVDPAQITGSMKLKDATGKSLSQYVATDGNILALKFMKDREARESLSAMDRAKIIPVFLERSKKEYVRPAVIADDVKFAYDVDLTQLKAYLYNELPDDILMNKLLSFLNL